MVFSQSQAASLAPHMTVPSIFSLAPWVHHFSMFAPEMVAIAAGIICHSVPSWVLLHIPRWYSHPFPSLQVHIQHVRLVFQRLLEVLISCPVSSDPASPRWPTLLPFPNSCMLEQWFLNLVLGTQWTTQNYVKAFEHFPHNCIGNANIGHLTHTMTI